MRVTGDFPAELVAAEPFLYPNQVVHMPEPKPTVGTGKATFLRICGLQKHLFLSVYNRPRDFTTTMPTAADRAADTRPSCPRTLSDPQSNLV